MRKLLKDSSIEMGQYADYLKSTVNDEYVQLIQNIQDKFSGNEQNLEEI